MSTKEIAETYDISIHHAAKASKWLVREGYVASTRGKGGGIHLAVEPQHINLGKLVKASSGDKKAIECVSKDGKHCKIQGACSLPSFFENAKHAYYLELSKYTLQDAIKSQSSLMKSLGIRNITL